MEKVYLASKSLASDVLFGWVVEIVAIQMEVTFLGLQTPHLNSGYFESFMLVMIAWCCLVSYSPFTKHF